MQTRPGSSPEPLITRRTVGWACLVVVLSTIVVGSVKATQQSLGGLIAAVGLGFLAVSILVAYGGAMVLAFRARSLLLFLLVFLIPVPPLGPMLCVLLTARPPGGPRPPRGGRPPGGFGRP